jgi:5-bromo-4-chloroindolyl phosphate hydrolysis protein
MENKNIISGIVGAGFFGAAYLALALPIAPALAVGGVAFVASELVISGNKKIQEKVGLSFKEKIILAKKETKYLKEMIDKIDDEGVSKDLEEIVKTSDKIVNRIEENHLENKTANKFMEYYLPVCVKIVGRYDEIENQSLTSKDSKEFMSNTAKILKATNKGFKRILNSLYQSDIVDADAEMKVLNTMLTADGFDETFIEDGEVDE